MKFNRCVWRCFSSVIFCSFITSYMSFLGSVSAQGLFDSAKAESRASNVEILRVTPSGNDVTTSGRQIVFSFNQAMVKLGQMQVDADKIPIEITPKIDCQWRWLNTQSLSCQLNRDDRLKNATQYKVKVHRGLISVSGASMVSAFEHAFVTQRPSVNHIALEQWVDAGKPVVNIRFNQPVTKASVERAIVFIASDNRYVSKVIAPIEWNPLQSEMFLKFADQERFIHHPKLASAIDAQIERIELAKRASAEHEARRLWRITLEDDLPPNTKISIGVIDDLIGIEGQVPGQRNAKVHQFTSLPLFKFHGIECESAQKMQRMTLSPRFDSSTNLRAGQLTESCDPLQRLALVFSAPVSNKSASDFIRFAPDLAGGDPNYDPWSTRSSQYQVQRFLSRRFNYADNSPFTLWLPEFLKAYEQYAVSSNEGLQDELGRRLEVPLDMAFLTAHRRPALDFEHKHSVLESNLESELPVYVTNLDQLQVNNYQITTATTKRGPFSFSKPLTKVEDIAYRVPLGVRDLLNGETGLVSGELSSEPIAFKYRSKRTFSFISQVTPFHVHLKLGHFKSLAWVTSMATGMPIADAQVSIELDNIKRIEPQRINDNESSTDKFGVVELPGLESIDPKLTHVYAYRPQVERLILKVRKGKDVAFLPVINEYRASEQIWPYLRLKDGHMNSWGTTAQGVYKAGDVVQYKVYVRGQSNRHWVRPPQGSYELSVVDPKGQVIKTVEDVKLNDYGAFSGEFKTLKSSAVGWYDFNLRFKNDITEHTQTPMRVLISDFTPSPFKVGNDLNGDRFALNETVSVRSYAKMHAGGPYSDAQARITASLIPKQFRSAHPKAKGFRFSASEGVRQVLHQSKGSLNNQGEWSAEFDITKSPLLYGLVEVETAVRDDRGKYVASRSSAEFFGAEKILGLRQTSWVQKVGETAAVDYLVVNQQGVPVKGSQVDLLVEYRVTRAARVKGAGDAYLTQYTDSWEELSRCKGQSTKSIKQCRFVPQQAGQHRITATINDVDGRKIENQIHTWAVGDGAVVWNDGNSHNIEIIADKSSYLLGDTAKFLVKNPYPGAQALITVERYGVLRSWQQTLKGSTPIIRVPIEEDDYPGIYLSVVVASPRVDRPLGDGNVDLGKPAFKMGYTKVQIRDSNKEIGVKIQTDKKVYKPRDVARVSVRAKPETGERKALELAVVVLDEAVFDLNSAGKGYYDPYKGFGQLEELGVANYNLLMRLVGRQRFEKKGANPGGGGGNSGADLRSLMKFVAYWNPSIETDNEGRAQFEFELPDNLTGWRVLVIAVDKEERMGLGDHNFKVNRPTELRPLMPNQLTAGDTVEAGFSVMNRTGSKRSLKVELRASGSGLAEPLVKASRIELAPFERKRVWLPVSATAPGEIAFYAKAGDSKDNDAIEHKVQIKPRYTLQSQVIYGTTTEPSLTESIQFPADLVGKVGGISVGLTPSVLGDIKGAFGYMKNYPHACWEQRLSIGVAAAQYQSLKQYLPDDFEWQKSKDLTQQALDNAGQFQAANGGMAYWINRDSYVSPYLSAYTALAFVWLREQGFIVPDQVERKLQAYLKGYLRNSDAQQLVNTQLSIRAVALAALASRGSIEVADLQRYEVHLPNMNLFAKAHFLKAATKLKWGEDRIQKISNSLLSNSVQSAGKFNFQETVAFDSAALLSSPARSNCAILSALLTAANSTSGMADLLNDIPFKLMRSITQSRGKRDSWSNTQENIFCMNAFREFSLAYENEDPNMKLQAIFKAEIEKGGAEKRESEDGAESVAEVVMGSANFVSVRDKPVTLAPEQFSIESNLKGSVSLSKQGEGRYYYNVKVDFAKQDDQAERLNAGIEVQREYSVQRDGAWQPLSNPMLVNKGELVRIDLFVSTPGVRNYVVVDDPVPGGLEPVNRDLATASTVDAGQSGFAHPSESRFYQHDDWSAFGRYGYSFYHQELRHDSVRFYSDYLPAGNYHLFYVAQVIANGSFTVKPLKVEEMYDPDVFGLGLPARLNVSQKSGVSGE